MSIAAPDLPLVKPAFFTHPDYTSTAGLEAIDLASSLMLPDGTRFAPDAEQQMILHAMYAETAPGASFTSDSPKWAAFEVGLVVSRQNLKTATYEMSVVADLWLLGARLVIWTAHLFQPAAAESFQHVKALIDSNDFLSKQVKRIHEASGHEGIELHNGARLKFLARSKNSGRSLSADVLIVDEAYKLTASELGATLPTLNARPNPQVRYGSSAAHLDSEALRGIIKRGRVGEDRLLFAEWCSVKPCADDRCGHVRGTPGCVADDPEERRNANPALGRRIGAQTLDDLRRALTPPEFMREVMGHHDDPKAGINSPLPLWPSRLDPASTVDPEWPLAFAVDVSWDRSTAWIAAAVRRPDGRFHLEVVAQGQGTEWVTPWLSSRLDRWSPVAICVQQNGAPASSLVDDLVEKLGTPLVRPMSGADMAKSAGMLFDATTEATVVHPGQQQLDAAAAVAAVRPVGESWAFDRKRSSVDVAPLVAVAQALWAISAWKEPTKRRAPKRLR